MVHDEFHEICRLIIEHVASPSVRHIRDKDAIGALAGASPIVSIVHRGSGANGLPCERT